MSWARVNMLDMDEFEMSQGTCWWTYMQGRRTDERNGMISSSGFKHCTDSGTIP